MLFEVNQTKLDTNNEDNEIIKAYNTNMVTTRNYRVTSLAFYHGRINQNFIKGIKSNLMHKVRALIPSQKIQVASLAKF